MEGRAKFLNTMKGRNREGPLFVPFIHSLAARTASITLEQMSLDPSYYTSALEGIRDLLDLDVVVANYDSTLEIEALGVKLNWPGDLDRPVLDIDEGVPGPLSPVTSDEFLNRGRISVVLETASRLVQTAARKTAVAVALTGPCSFFSTLSRYFQEAGAKEPSELIKEYGGLLTKLVKGVCDNRVDAVFFREDLLGGRFPELLSGELAGCKSSYATLFNIVKAYNAQPLVITETLSIDNISNVRDLLKPSGIVLLGHRCAVEDFNMLYELANSLRIAIGVPVPVGLTDNEDLSAWVETLNAFSREKSPQNIFYTSDGEIPHDADMEKLLSLTEELNQAALD